MDKSIILRQIGSNIRKFRIAKGLSQEKLAEKCGFDRTYISLVERGKRNLSIFNLVKIARALDITPSEILEDIDSDC